MRSLWEKASKAKPQDQEIQMKWFRYAFEGDDWKSAQKAAMSLQINFPKTRKYHFWAIFLSYLIAIDAASSEADRKLFGTLAYRMVSKAAESVPSDPKELLSPPKAIQNTEELLLLIKIFESQDRHSEIAKILESENLGITSRIVQNDWALVGAKILSLEKAGMWTEGLSYTKNLLKIPTNEAEKKALQECDDWTVWNLLITAVKNINTPETTTETQDYIKEFISAEPKSRNAQLARLDLIHWGFQSGTQSTDDLLSACQEYFDNNKHKLYSFSDLQKYLPALDNASLSKFVQHALKLDGNEANGKGVSKINALKLEYCFQLSYDDANVSRPRIEDFVARCLQVYRETDRPERTEAPSTIESEPSDDLCLLAAMSLIRFSGAWINGNQDQVPDTALIRAAGILERLIIDSPHNYQSLLLLVRIYLRLGAGSLALKTFSKLSVKQLQYETVAHNLFTRLATIHPHSAPPIEGAEYKDFNPQSAFVQALNFYRSADLTTIRNRTNGLDFGSYINVEGTIQLQSRLKNSICRRMWALDVKRMQRMVGGDPMSRYDDVAKDTSPVSDQRVFDAFMNCEAPGKATVEERMRLGPLPREQWVKSTRVTDQLFGNLKNMALQKPVASHDLPSLEDLVSNAETELTAPEIENTKVQLNLLKVTSFMSGSKSVTSEDVDSSLTQVEEWLDSKSKYVSSDDAKLSPIVSGTAIFLHPESPSAPSWKYLHEVFIILESLKAVSQVGSLALKKASKSVKLPKDRVERLVESTRKLHESVRANIRGLKARISEPGTLGTLIDLVMIGTDSDAESKQLQSELEKTLDVPALEMLCGELMESWEEGLDGMLTVTL
ncbi:hypothetical protein AWENTII_004114 [Aspergillus wentii]